MYCRKGEGANAGAPVEFSLIPLSHYADCTEVPYDSPSALLEDFYARKNLYTRIRQRSADLRHIVQTILERDVHKYDLQCRQIRDTEKKDKYRLYGELLNAYGYSIPSGEASCVVDNYYTGEKMTIPLDPSLTPQQNAKKYFDRYARMKRTSEALTSLTEQVKAEIDHLRSIQNALEFSTTDSDLSQIRQEMEESGYLRRKYAGQNSGRSQGKVEIDYLERKNVKKPSGAAPGFVVYYTNYSILAKTDISALKEVTD